MAFEHLNVTVEEGVACVAIDRPQALNALNPEVLAELSRAFTELELNPEVMAIILTGEGKAFVAGADIAAMAEMGTREAQAFAELGGSLTRSIEEASVPVIAAVNGFALGGGCELALACDFIYASEKAKFGQPEVKLGVIPGFGGTQRLGRRVGVAKAKELIFTGDIIGADEALRIGLVDRLFAPDELMTQAIEVAKRIAANGAIAVSESKRVIHEGLSMALEQGNRLEQLAFAGLFSSEDQKEGMAAFLEKRDPKFKGR